MQEISLSEYLSIDRKISSYRRRKLQKKIRIALLGSFSLNGFKETLNVKCRDAGIDASFYVNDYNQYANELINKNSKFYKFKPDITFFLVDIRAILGDTFFDPYNGVAKKRKDIVEDRYRHLHILVRNFLQYGSGILVVNNFEIPTYSPIGILEPKEKFGFFDMVKSLNTRISAFNRHGSIFVFDYDSFASEIGKKNVRDDTLFYLADMKVSPEIIPLLCDEYMKYIRALKGLTRKCLVLDMDNTLWGGIIGEDGFDGIKLGPSPPGNAYMEFQKYLLALFHRGIILAVNSNNNSEDVLKVLREHPYMILKKRHFASMKINWENKIENLVTIAKDINIGLDSLIFLDDDRRTREIVREALPEVLCPDLPEDASQYARFLTDIKCLDTLQITPEDKRRGRLYAAERKRKESMRAFSNLSKYLEHFHITVDIKPADKFSIPRLSQLTLRTNQFNFATRRYDENKIGEMIRDRKYNVYYIRVKDKYGDYGITGAAIIRKDKKEWFIDTFLLSCRILGRNIEDAVLSAIVKKAARENTSIIRIAYRKTDKNRPVSEFLKRYGVLAGEDKPKNSTIVVFEKGKKLRFGRIINYIKVIPKWANL